jgi:hypothetical protein
MLALIALFGASGSTVLFRMPDDELLDRVDSPVLDGFLRIRPRPLSGNRAWWLAPDSARGRAVE